MRIVPTSPKHTRIDFLNRERHTASVKNCIIVPTKPAFCIRLAGAPPLSGWAIRLIAGIDDEEIRPGFWMSRWYSDQEVVEFAFERELHMVFNSEADARKVRKFLVENADISTEVVQI